MSGAYAIRGSVLVVIAIRVATMLDLDALLPRTRALNDHEGITVPTATLAAALARLIDEPVLGAAWMIERDGAPIGYALCTYGFDLEYGGRDAWLTELWIDDGARGGRAGATVLDLLSAELKNLGIGALHLQVRPENPALRLYQRAGFTASPRIVMTRTIG